MVTGYVAPCTPDRPCTAPSSVLPGTGLSGAEQSGEPCPWHAYFKLSTAILVVDAQNGEILRINLTGFVGKQFVFFNSASGKPICDRNTPAVNIRHDIMHDKHL